MSFGDPAWAGWVLPEAESLSILKAAYDAGINTFDTADMYSNGQSEVIVGKAIQKYNIPREKVVILSKLYFAVDETDVSNRVNAPGPNDWINQRGLSRKHIFDAVDASVRRLGTYIDVLQIHRLDHETEPEEIMKALHDVVQSGKVRYIGASSMYAHEFAMLQFTATLNHWTPFISMQNFYNLLYREEEREMIPFCKKMGVGLIPWSPMARGMLTRPYEDKSTTRISTDPLMKALYLSKEGQREGLVDQEITGRVQKVAADRGVSMATVALSWVLSKGCAPIVGLSSEKRLKEAVDALKFKLSEEETKFLEGAYSPKAIQGH